jgi:hypothetical protein
MSNTWNFYTSDLEKCSASTLENCTIAVVIIILFLGLLHELFSWGYTVILLERLWAER